MGRAAPRVTADERGTSLVELMIAAAIFMVLLGAVLTMLDSGTRTERAQQARHDALLDLRTALLRIDKDLRQALSISSDSTRDRLVMHTLIAGEAHIVAYEVLAGELTRSIDGTGAGRLASRVTALPFCYDPPDCVASAPAGPRMVRVSLQVTPEVASSGPITLATDVHLRNL